MTFLTRFLGLICIIFPLAGCATVSGTASAAGDVVDAGTSPIP
ncbi:hypothetical protein ACJU26_04480 [Acidithiobacillus sp. M4-SHS-6]